MTVRLTDKQLVELSCHVAEDLLNEKSKAFRLDMVERMGQTDGSYPLSPRRRRWVISMIHRCPAAGVKFAEQERRLEAEHQRAREQCRAKHPESCCCVICAELRAEEAK